MNLYKKSFLALLFTLPILTYGQVDPQIKNTYSLVGLGELQPFSSIRNLGMGGLGTAVSTSQYLNFQNPALLSRNRMFTHTVLHNETMATIAKTYSVTEEEIRDLNKISEEVKEGAVIKIPVRKYTLWEAGVQFTQQHTRSTPSSLDYKHHNINFQYFAFSFPVSQRISASGGLIPFSQTGAVTVIPNPPLLSGSIRTTTLKRDGGINQAFLGAGFDISRNLSVGINAGYLFGNIAEENFTGVDSLNGRTSNIGTVNRNIYNGFLMKPGLFYRTHLNKANGDSSLFLNFGFTTNLYTRLHTANEATLQYRTLDNGIDSSKAPVRTVFSSTIPSSLNIGLSLSRSEFWTIGTEFYYAGNGSFFTANAYKISLGGEMKIGLRRERTSVKAPTFRAGLAYGQLPYLADNKEVKEYSVSLGASVPMGKINNADKHQPLSKINVAVIGGIIGNESLSTGRQLYLKAQAGVLINDKWFRKRRIN